MKEAIGKILREYDQKIIQRNEFIVSLKIKLSNLSFYQFCIFVLATYIFFSLINQPLSLGNTLLPLSPFLIFIWLAIKKQHLQKEIVFNQSLIMVYENEIKVINSKVNSYDNGESFKNPNHLYSSDLDIFGSQSLFSFINRCKTDLGIKLLSKTLTAPNTRAEIIERQEAIAALEGQIERTFDFRARLIRHHEDHTVIIYDKFHSELKDELSFTRDKKYAFYTRLTPYLTAAALLTCYLGGWFLLFPLTLFSINFAIFFVYLPKNTKLFERLDLTSALLEDYALAMTHLQKVKWSAPYMTSFTSSSAWFLNIKKLKTILKYLELNHHPISRPLLNIFFMWDAHCALHLNKWYEKHAAEFLNGLSTISKFEELISFATLKYNNPSWSFPLIKDEAGLIADQLCHPLIHMEKSIPNNYTFLNQPTVDIITGSNMAGKSTFLRTIGVNLILAYSGSVVCGKHLETSIYNLVSYMRIKDSVNEDTSTFKAELNRIKIILNQLKRDKHNLVIVDEMLRGTNSYDKYTGSKAFIKRIIKEESQALFATHDLQLSELEFEHQQKIRNYHFDVVINQADMVFDYKIKEGPCKTFNAQFLLREAGLSDD